MSQKTETPKIKLTDKIVRDLSFRERGYRFVRDSEVVGFRVRVTTTVKAFTKDYRCKADGRERRIKIGEFPDWSVVAARERAKEIQREVDNGGDPQGTLDEQRGAPTVEDLCDRFEKQHLPRKRKATADTYSLILRLHVKPALGNRKVAALSFSEIDALHRSVTKKSGPYQANRTIAVLSKACSLAVRWGWRADNPCKGIERNDETKRRRYVDGDELKRLLKALAEHDDRDAADIFWLLLLTGARRGEVLAMRWADVHLKARKWIKPGATTKTRTEHEVPLNPQAVELLAARKRVSDYVFPGRLGGHRVNVKSDWRQICQKAQIRGLRIHDLRHSFASQAASAGIGLHVIGGLLGHTQASTTFRYAHLFSDPLRAATDKVGALITGAASAKIVPLKGRRR